MCELFGMSCDAEDNAKRSLKILADEYSHDNPHGWGIAYYVNGEAIVEKADEKALSTDKFNSVIEKAKSKIFIAHLRKASNLKKSPVCMKNCHPFDKELFNRDWIFAHNGTFKNFPDHKDSKGNTDSENIFHTLVDQIESYQQNGFTHGTFSGIQQGIKTVFEKEKEKNRTLKKKRTLNFLMSDGTILYAFNHNKDKPMYYLERNRKEYGSAFLISTRKLSPEKWKPVRPDSLLMVINGKILELSDPIKIG